MKMKLGLMVNASRGLQRVTVMMASLGCKTTARRAVVSVVDQVFILL